MLQFEVNDSRVGFVTVTGVRVSSDLRHARVFVSLLAKGDERERAMEAIRTASGFLRRRIGQTLRLRYTPELVFSLDTSIEKGARIEEVLMRDRARDKKEDSG